LLRITQRQGALRNLAQQRHFFAGIADIAHRDLACIRLSSQELLRGCGVCLERIFGLEVPMIHEYIVLEVFDGFFHGLLEYNHIVCCFDFQTLVFSGFVAMLLCLPGQVEQREGRHDRSLVGGAPDEVGAQEVTH